MLYHYNYTNVISQLFGGYLQKFCKKAMLKLRKTYKNSKNALKSKKCPKI